MKFFKYLSYLGTGPIGIGFFVLFFVFSTREKAFYILLAQTCCQNLNLEMKIIYHDPRPYMVFSDIEAVSCSKSFGNPSGHSNFSACFYLTLFLMYFHDVDYTVTYDRIRGRSRDPDSIVGLSPKSREIFQGKSTCGYKVFYGVILGLTLMLIFCIMLSRIVLGVHSLD